MSLVASFYIMSADKSDDLLRAATPESRVVESKGIIFKKKKVESIDNFLEFLSKNASEQERYPYSGAGFNDLDLILEEKECRLFDYGSSDLANKLSDVRATSMSIYDHTSAKSTLDILNRIELTKQEVISYLKEEHPDEDCSLGAEAVLAALRITKEWLSSVDANHIGLLIVG